MERYLTSEQIRNFPPGEKYKKITYGGRKFFVKIGLPVTDAARVVGEFFNKNQCWKMEKDERRRVNSLGVKKSSIRDAIVELSLNALKKPISQNITTAQYANLYQGYPDIDKLGYYEKESPEYVRVKNVLSVVDRNSLVYDAGCNSGGIGKILIKEKSCKVFGSEISPEVARIAEGKGLNVFCGWAEKTNFENDYFDFVILDFILEHAINPEKVMRESVRVLKREGVLLGHVPTEFGDWGKHTIGNHPEHLRAYNQEELKNLLKKASLNSISIKKEKLVGRRVADYYFFTAKK